MRAITLTLIITFFIFASVNLTASPFNRGALKEPHISQSASLSMDQVYTYIAKKQQTLKGKIAKMIRQLKQGESNHLFFSILSLTFIYGMIHAAGPGHGKSIIFSYLVGKKDPQIKRTLALCWFVPVAQGLSAMAVIYGIYYLSLGSLVSTFQKASRHANLISFSLILGIGIALLTIKIRSIQQHKKHAKDEDSKDVKRRSNLPLILTLGVTPCPGVMILLTFLLAMRLNELAIFLVAAMTAGMAVTISFIGIFTAYSKKKLLQTIEKKGKKLHQIEDILEITGALLLVTLGAVLLIGHLQLHPLF